MIPAKVADGAKVGLLVHGEKPEGDITLEQAVDLSGPTYALSRRRPGL